MQRREFICSTMGMAGGALASLPLSHAENSIDSTKAKQYLKSIMPSHERVIQFTSIMTPEESMKKSNGWTYDADLGWVHCDAVHSNGINRSKTFYHYESDGARKVINFPNTPCRIHAYGNSFTHCDQVNDGETWSEYLATHLQEPIRNYGVGGYSVYQAYRRMLKVEEKNSAEYIILNIWDDDHFRNLDAWRSIRFGQGSNCGFTLPHLAVDIQNDLCEQKENVLKVRENVQQLRDEEYIWETFQNDPVLKLVLAARNGNSTAQELINPVAVSFGIPEETISNSKDSQLIKKIHTEAALFSTKKIVTWTENYAKQTGKKLMIVLSFGKGNITRELQGEPRFDQSFVDFLKLKPYPVIDLRDVYMEKFQKFKGNVDEFLRPYFIGHHTPAGNFLLAWALMDTMVKWLNPAPRPYR